MQAKGEPVGAASAFVVMAILPAGEIAHHAVPFGNGRRGDRDQLSILAHTSGRISSFTASGEPAVFAAMKRTTAARNAAQVAAAATAVAVIP